MKKLSFCLTCCVFAGLQLIHAQSSMGIENDLRGITSNSAGSIGISTFGNPSIKGTRYLFDNWTPGSVTALDGQVYSANYSFNFDKIDQGIYAKDSKSNISVLLDKSKVRRFVFGSSSFVSSVSLKAAQPNLFYQVLVEDTNNICLYKLTTTKFVKANPNDIMAARTGNMVNEYVDDNKYYFSVKNGELKKIDLKENNIRKALKDKKDKVDAYFTMNDGSDLDEAFLVGLFRYINK